MDVPNKMHISQGSLHPWITNHCVVKFSSSFFEKKNWGQGFLLHPPYPSPTKIQWNSRKDTQIFETKCVCPSGVTTIGLSGGGSSPQPPALPSPLWVQQDIWEAFSWATSHSVVSQQPLVSIQLPLQLAQIIWLMRWVLELKNRQSHRLPYKDNSKP